MKKINSEEFNNIIEEDKLNLVCFGATWCGKCKMAEQKFPAYESALNGLAKIYKIDADESKEVFEKYGVEHMPILILFKSGNELGRRSALGTPDGILDFVKNFDKNDSKN